MLSNYTFCASSGHPVAFSTVNTKPCSLKTLNAADQLHLKIFFRAPTCFAFCYRRTVAQGCKTLQRPPAHQSLQSWGHCSEHRLHLGSQSTPGAVTGDPFHQQVPRRTLPTNGGKKELPGEGVWLKLLAGAQYQECIPSGSHRARLFLFSSLFGSRATQVQMKPHSEPGDWSSFQLNKNHSKLINKSLQMGRNRFMH